MKEFYVVLTKIHRVSVFFFWGKDGDDISLKGKKSLLPDWDWLFDYTEKIALSKKTYFMIIWC